MENLDFLKIASNVLKSQRRKLNISIDQVSIELKLQINIINDIENGNFNTFRSYFFLKGYIENYANFLDVKVNLPELKTSNEKTLKDNYFRKKNEKKFINIFLLIFFIFLIALSISNLNTNKKVNIIKKDKKYTSLSSDAIEKSVDNLVVNNQTVITQNNDDTEVVIVEEKNFISDSDTEELLTGDNVVINTLYIECKFESWTEIIDSSGNIVFFDLVAKNKSIKINISAPFEILLGDATEVIIKYNDKIVDVTNFNPDTKVGKLKIK